jgi:hypothetical protein
VVAPPLELNLRGGGDGVAVPRHQRLHHHAVAVAVAARAAPAAGAYTRALLSSTLAVLVSPARVPLSNRLGENHALNVSIEMWPR